jgi:3-deoxy-alpha-D-manno-octulosonate 8-oxidase
MNQTSSVIPGASPAVHRNLHVVPQLVFGRGSVRQLGAILDPRRGDGQSPAVFVIDDVHAKKDFVRQLPAAAHDHRVFVNVDKEPKTAYVDELTLRIRGSSDGLPCAIVGIGGGSTLDIAKAVSLMLTNPGSSSEYQGWDLVRHGGIYHVGIPTLAGTGAEISRTTVLTGPTRKLGINSDHTCFDQIVYDPDLLDGAPREQRFYTAMDCFIHAVEALNGTLINGFARAYAEKSQSMCRDVFLGAMDEREADETLMVASYFGGMSISYSQVGICHALSYGLSFVLGIHHGIGNCIVFDHLDEYYPDDVPTFREMMKRNDIRLPQAVSSAASESQMTEMIRVALGLGVLWENTLGPAWRDVMTPDRVRELYLRM